MLDNILAVYTGESVTNLTLVTKDRGEQGPAKVVFEAQEGTNYVIAAAGANGTMGEFTLYWCQCDAPIIVHHPVSTNIVAGESVTFSALAMGDPVPSYQWLSNGVAIAGATNADYTLTEAQANSETNQFYFSLLASNVVDTATSQTALLVVHDAATAKITNSLFTANSYFVMHVHGVTNRPYAVETATNLNGTIQWTSVHTNYVSFNYTDFMTSNDVARFYRILALPLE